MSTALDYTAFLDTLFTPDIGAGDDLLAETGAAE
jgi:hypothetical protein